MAGNVGDEKTPAVVADAEKVVQIAPDLGMGMVVGFDSHALYVRLGVRQERFLHFLGRAYTDPSPVVREFIDTHYLETLGRFFFAFQSTLPELSRDDLGFRLNFAMGALSGILAGGNTQRLIHDFTQGQGDQEVTLLSRLISLMVAALKAPLPGPDDTTVLDAIVRMPAVGSLAPEV